MGAKGNYRDFKTQGQDRAKGTTGTSLPRDRTQLKGISMSVAWPGLGFIKCRLQDQKEWELCVSLFKWGK